MDNFNMFATYQVIKQNSRVTMSPAGILTRIVGTFQNTTFIIIWMVMKSLSFTNFYNID